MKVAVITISDRASAGVYEDLSGAEIEHLLRTGLPDAVVTRDIVPDEEDRIRDALRSNGDADYIFTTGGTGIGPRDITPDVTRSFCDRELPGVAEMLRAESFRETRNAVFSRGYAGVRGGCIVVNFPGSVKAVRLCVRCMLPVMEHGVRMLRGEGHEHRVPGERDYSGREDRERRSGQ